jgi:hypothetical protein
MLFTNLNSNILFTISISYKIQEILIPKNFLSNNIEFDSLKIKIVFIIHVFKLHEKRAVRNVFY